MSGEIKVTVTGIDKRWTVKHGFDAPDDVVIVMEELLDKENPA